jgi:ankyrin repeat protein
MVIKPKVNQVKNGEFGMSNLMYACIDNNYNQVVCIVEVLKEDINYQRTDGQTALMHAVYKKNYKIATYLCENGADKDLKDEIDNTALMHAIYSCPEIAMYLIINGANINIKNKLGEYPVHFAAMNGNHLIMKMLYDRGVELNIYNINKHSPIMMACSNQHYKCVRYLIQNGASLNDEDYNNDNLLHACIYHERYDMLLLFLINKNLKVLNSRNYDGETPLMNAVKEKKFEYTKLLLKYGADVNTFDKNGYTPLMHAAKQSNFELTELLLKHNADPNIIITYPKYASPLYLAVNGCNPKTVQLLLDNNANDIMYVCIEMDDYENFEKILLNKFKYTVDSKNYNGETYLFFAAVRNKIKYVKLLLENGADPNINNTKLGNESPLYHAILNKNYEMVKLLIEYNANYFNRLYNSLSLAHIHCNSDKYKYGESLLTTAIKCSGQHSNITNYLENLGGELFYE